MPSGCSIRAGNEWREWRGGEGLVFDDSWEHEVVHRCAAQRVVFQLVFEHPDLQQLLQRRPQGGARRGEGAEEQV